MSGPTIDRAASSGDIWTPQPFIDAVEKKFGPLEIDLAASPASAKAPLWFGPGSSTADALAIEWNALFRATKDGHYPLCWLNPPFRAITPWARKCAAAWLKGAEILLLVPGSIGANWFEHWVWPYADVYSIGRMVFDNCFDRRTGELVTTPYAKDLVLAHYGPNTGQQLIFWKDWHEKNTRTLRQNP